MSTIVESLTKNIVSRDLQKEGAALLNKWEKTGLLEGLDNERTRQSMARLLENQAKELLREASTMSAGDVEGFAAVAFPIVRRVFGGLIANELVSVQPMSLPSGLIFFLDFTFANTREYAGATAGQSIYGGAVRGADITGGVNLGGANAETSFYSLNNAYSSPSGTNVAKIELQPHVSYDGVLAAQAAGIGGGAGVLGNAITDEPSLRILSWDPDVTNDGTNYYVAASGTLTDFTNSSVNDLIAMDVSEISGAGTSGAQTVSTVRRLTKLDPADRSKVIFVLYSSTQSIITNFGTDAANDYSSRAITTRGITNSGCSWSRADLANANTTSIGALDLDLWDEGAGDGVGSSTHTGLAGQNFVIPEIDIQVDSISVTAETKKLKAKWSPELAQDLNAYHNLDAEVELTSILSEQIALEIDQEILEDLLKGATGARLYWSRRPGKFVNRETGVNLASATAPPDFTGTVSEWYETLAETINDVSARIHRKTLRGGANFVVCSPEVANLLEFTSGFRATISADELKGNSVGAAKVGSMSKKFDVYVDPYFPRSVVLVGRRGNSFLESGFVYAPYVPLQVTPTIFGVEDFVPRKGVLTRYAKKMVRPDMYGVVVVENMTG